jgi:hypothetical protein
MRKHTSMTVHTSEEAIMESIEEAEEEALEHLGKAIHKLQDADRPEKASSVEEAWKEVKYE